MIHLLIFLTRIKTLCIHFFVAASMSMLCTNAYAVSFDFIDASPVGSWQVREDVDTNHKGKQTGTTIKTSMVGKELRNEKVHYWIEMQIDSFKIKKNGKRKATGKRVIMKSLIPNEALKADPENAINNLRAFGVETIIQSGDEAPMRMTDTGGLISGVMSAANVEINHDFQDEGSEKVTVAAGDFTTRKVTGTGHVSTKIVFKKLNIESTSTAWVSNKVPFGFVKGEGTTVTNGKKSTQTSELLEFGHSGAKTGITQEPKDLPSFKDMF